MQVTGWTNWDDKRYINFGGSLAVEAEIVRVVAAEMRKCGYKFSGAYHQSGDYGVPIIDNKWKLCCSERYWGEVMVKAYPDEIDNSDGYGYIFWAWAKPDNRTHEIVPYHNEED